MMYYIRFIGVQHLFDKFSMLIIIDLENLYLGLGSIYLLTPNFSKIEKLLVDLNQGLFSCYYISYQLINHSLDGK